MIGLHGVHSTKLRLLTLINGFHFVLELSLPRSSLIADGVFLFCLTELNLLTTRPLCSWIEVCWTE
jgi:hypothetical protein